MGKNKIKTYQGTIDTSDPLTDRRYVEVDGQLLPPAATGFADYAWGYAGSGPGRLADALCVSLIGAMDPDVRGVLLDLISNLDEDSDWTLTSDQFGIFLHSNLPPPLWAAIQHRF